MAWLPAERVWGVDFSGAADAGSKIWLAEGLVEDDRLQVVDISSVAERLDAGVDRMEALTALREFVERRSGVFAIDAPFGLPAPIVTDLLGVETWKGSLSAVSTRYDGPQELADACSEWVEANVPGGGVYLRRTTDDITDALCPYHWLVRHQTYHAIVDLLAPLIEREAIYVPPVWSAPDDPTRTRLIETYPAATLERLGLPADRYTGDGHTAHTRRESIVDGLEVAGISFAGSARTRCTSIEGGHAVDAAVAAFAAMSSTREPETTAPDRVDERTRLEGHIYA